MTTADTARRYPPARTLAAALALVGILGTSAACDGTAAAPEINPAGDIPDNQAFVPFTSADGTFSVSVPEGWSRASIGTATLFTDKLNRVRIEQAASAAPVDAASVRARDLPVVARSTPGYAPGDVRVVGRSAGPAVLATYSAASTPDPVTGRSVAESVERYAFWRAGREVVLTLSAPTGADNVDPWRKVTDSFRWLR